ncbi:MAG: hypothetical protein HGA93_03520 [Methanothrix sp.]|nr:hypothetical protein [Methanothrix sp.]
MLIIGGLASNACAAYGTDSAQSMDGAPAGSEYGQNIDQVSADQVTVDQVLSPSTIALTLYVLERRGNGTPLSGVEVTVYDAAGHIFSGITSSDEPLVITGQPGAWQFTLAKEGYKTVNMAFDVTNISAAVASLERIGQSPEPVALTIYVHDGDFDGAMLPGVQVSGQDAAGNNFEGMTDSSGAFITDGVPGIWQLILSKEGYDSAILVYNLNQTGEIVAYLQRTSQSQERVALEPVALTIHVHDGDLNGTLLADVLVGGQDAAGNSFEGMTDSNGTVTIGGVPGTWQFTFSKEGYETLSLSYNATVTEDTGAYLLKAEDSEEDLAPAQLNQ